MDPIRRSVTARLQLIRHLVNVESQTVGIERPKTLATANDLISTAQAAELLGYSRPPYVAMLIDQNKLKGAIVSAGGHRRVSRAAVMEWHTRHQVMVTLIQEAGPVALLPLHRMLQAQRQRQRTRQKPSHLENGRSGH